MTAEQDIQDPQVAAAMRGYQYKHGDRPLEGYTIQRGAGRGGFGEVYYAISDSGREVALKLIHTYEQIELRGISQCMNLKSPHLVTIFDVKYGNDGRPWVIMEYVSGPSLRQLLDAAPSGLGAQKAAFFLREIAKGLSYLHDCGIVHRDLKPANIFYENGYVKIGDYGLSKIISTSQHSGQTVTVGTVHYMAPEIGVGNYDRGIDIYALGALLYEMLTGQVPFFGSSTAEVLMKHLSSNVDVSGIEEPFKTVILKAMAKNPADRYQSVQEMVEAVYGSEHVRNSVSAFSPDSLTMVAGYAAQKIPPSGSFTPSDVAPPPAWQCDRWQGVMDRVGDRLERKRQWMEAKWERKRQRFAQKFGYPPPPSGNSGESDFANMFSQTSGDPLKFWHRVVLASISVFIVGLVAATMGGGGKMGPALGILAILDTAAAAAAALTVWQLVGPALRNESPWLARLVIGGAATLPVIVLSLPAMHNRHMAGGVLAIFVGFILMDWRARLSAIRPDRVVFGKLVTAGLLGLFFGGMFAGAPAMPVAVLLGTSLAAMIAAPWRPQPATAAPPRRPPVPPVAPMNVANAPVAPSPAAAVTAAPLPPVAV
ncbi:MAG TPA: serine/threonine-protein kinase, partial [Tepidisphaeraceae bacterium]|nr:serine/threonine-protein kinase [Tepidisphaeraceae bacterium]